VIDWFRTTTFQIGSRPGWLKSARYKTNKKAIIPQAKALHRIMSEGLATGDKKALNRACVKELSTRLAAAIETRPRTKRYEWELVKYTKAAKLCGDKVVMIADKPKQIIVRQVVVRIQSRQRLVEYEGISSDKVVSEREMDVRENVVMSRLVDGHTYEQSDWRIWGTISDTTPESWAEDKSLMKDVEAAEVSKHKLLKD
jgi:protein MBA1